MRRENGSGTIYYRKDKSKPYSAIISVNVDGKRKRKVLGQFLTEKEAKMCLKKYEQESKIIDINKCDLTFKDVYEKLIQQRKLNGKTKRPEKEYLPAFLAVSSIHHIKFTKLNKDMLYQALVLSGKNQPTLRKVILLYNLMYKYAIAEKIVAFNEAASITIGAHSELNKNPNKITHRSFSKEEIEELLSDNINNEMRDIFKVLIYTGMRINEFYTLTKKSVNLENKTIFIDKIYAKTESSIRYIPIHPDIFDIIERKYNSCVNDDSPLFTQANGKIFRDRNFRDSYWNPYMRLHNIEDHRPHDTRYTFSTFWDYCNLNTRDGEVILGHGSKSNIEKLYKTPDIEHRYKIMCKLNFSGEEIIIPKEEYNRDSVNDFFKAKAEMKRLGFDNMDEYFEYLDYMKRRTN